MWLITQIKKLFIPHGFYCYQILRVTPDKEIGFRIQERKCPFYRYLEDIEGFCILENEYVLDECKTCGLNQYTDKEIKKMIKNNEKLGKREIL